MSTNDIEKPWLPPQATTVTPLKPLKPLTSQRQAFVQELVSNPKATPTSAALKTYNVTSNVSASNVANHLMQQENVKLELAKYSDRAKQALLQVIQETSDRLPGASDRDVAPIATVLERTANSVIDRVEGKATQRVEVQSQAVVINIDLSSVA